MSTSNPIVQVRSVSFRREGTHILRDVSWTIASGEHWALLGANGSGKTTLLKILTGYEWASEGALEVLGRRFGECDVRELRKTIGWLSAALQPRIPPQARVLDVALSGLDAALRIYRRFDAEEIGRAHDALSQVRMDAFAGRSFATLSQGEQQRVLIARALICRPALLILDEPCAGLDPAARERFLAELAAFVESDAAPTTVLVTHHVEEVGPWITHGLALKDGVIIAKGPIKTVLNDTTFSTMLDVPCRIHESNGRYRIQMDSTP